MIELAYAMAPGAEGGGNPMMQFLPLIAIIFIFYFILIRPQQKRNKEHQKMLGGMKEGDKVITSSGIYGTVAKVEEGAVILEIADRVRIKVAKGHVSNIISKTSAPSP